MSNLPAPPSDPYHVVSGVDTFSFYAYGGLPDNLVSELLLAKFSHGQRQVFEHYFRQFFDSKFYLQDPYSQHEIVDHFKRHLDIIVKDLPHEKHAEEDAPEQLEDLDPQFEFSLGDERFLFQPFSLRRQYDISLVNNCFTIHFRTKANSKDSAKNPPALIEMRSGFLWSKGWLGAITQAKEWVQAWFPESELIVRRTDFAFDVQGDFVGLLSDSHFVCRSVRSWQFRFDEMMLELQEAVQDGRNGVKKLLIQWREQMQGVIDEISNKAQIDQDCENDLDVDAFLADVRHYFKEDARIYENGVLSMVSHGKRGGEAAFLRAYRKDLELKRASLDKREIMQGVYTANDLNMDQALTRIEFELTNHFYRTTEFMIDGDIKTIRTVDDFLTHWQYVVAYLFGDKDRRGWCTLHSQANAKADRTPIHPLWLQLRQQTKVPNVASRGSFFSSSFEDQTKRSLCALLGMVAHKAVANGYSIEDILTEEDQTSLDDMIHESADELVSSMVDLLKQEETISELRIEIKNVFDYLSTRNTPDRKPTKRQALSAHYARHLARKIAKVPTIHDRLSMRSQDRLSFPTQEPRSEGDRACQSTHSR